MYMRRRRPRTVSFKTIIQRNCLPLPPIISRYKLQHYSPPLPYPSRPLLTVSLLSFYFPFVFFHFLLFFFLYSFIILQSLLPYPVFPLSRWYRTASSWYVVSLSRGGMPRFSTNIVIMCSLSRYPALQNWFLNYFLKYYSYLLTGYFWKGLNKLY